MKRTVKILFLAFFIFSCGRNEFTVSGKILYKDKAVSDAEVAVYLKYEKDKDTPPVKVVATDEKGEFQVKLKKGKYFFTSRKKLEEFGEINMLVGSYSDKAVEVKGDLRLSDWMLHSKKENEEFKKGLGIKGLVKDFSDYRKVRVYVYRDRKSSLRGPDYIAQSKIDKDGSFKIDLKEGSFYISARERKGSFVGPLKEGDKSAEYSANPVKISEGYYDVGVLRLKNLDSKKLSELKNIGYFKEGVAEVSGIVVDEDGKPLKNVYVLAYKDQEMVGRPVTISIPSGADGRFVIKLPEEGKYYIGARTKIGGPAEPGERVGSIKGSVDKSLSVKAGDRKKVVIEAREIW